MARGVKFIRWDLGRLVDQVRSVCEVDANGCWIWRYGSFRAERYPDIMISRRKQSVARWILEVTTGVAGEVARHSCDRMPCCNPDHLLWGTQADNVADRVDRGRSAMGDESGFRKYPEKYRGDNHWTQKRPELVKRGSDNPRTGVPFPAVAGDNNPSRKHPELLARGEEHGLSKLKTEQVLAIRERHAQGATIYRLAQEYAVTKRTIQQIVRRLTWRHV